MESEVYRGMSEREDGFWWHKGMRKITTKVLRQYLPVQSGLKILDAGCATGGMFSLLLPFGQITGVDLSTQAIELAAKRGIADVMVADINHLPFPDNSFDLVLCSDVLYHQGIEDDNRALRELQRVLVPGGHLLLREAAYNWLRSEHDRLVWTKRRFTKPELIDKLQQAGFTVIRSSYINFFLFPLALLVRLSERLRKNLNSEQSYFIIRPSLNSLLYFWLWLESKLISRISFPCGLSIIFLSRKNTK
ncbi:MAG: class I SAM-dependent methyltransferase [Candidatus Komeilibacteria bacterium]